jgi:hypothetical protein
MRRRLSPELRPGWRTFQNAASGRYGVGTALGNTNSPLYL